MRASTRTSKFSDRCFGDESIIAQQRYLNGEISRLEYDLTCNAVLNDLYRAVLYGDRGSKRR